jgi:hypothetical protein
MAYVGRQEEHRALAQLDPARPAILDHIEPSVPFELPEEFLVGVVMKIGASVGPAHHRDDEVGIFPNLLIADRRLQQMLVLGEPFGKVDWRQHAPIIPDTAERDNTGKY